MSKRMPRLTFEGQCVIVISNDESRLGSATTEDGLAAYADQLERKLSAEFGDCVVQLQQVFETEVRCDDDDLRNRVAGRMREIEESEEWIELLTGA